MHTKTQNLMLQGAAILAGALVVSSIGGWARHATADAQPSAETAAAVLEELHSLSQTLEATKGELTVARLQLERANAVIEYSAHYGIPADLSGSIYDIAQSEGVDPNLAFRLVRVESGFNPKAHSRAGALGLTQVLPSTARLYEPGLASSQLFDPSTNLRMGFRYLHDLLDRYDNLERALLAYNRGPGKVQELLAAGVNPQNGYSHRVTAGYRRRR